MTGTRDGFQHRWENLVAIDEGFKTVSGKDDWPEHHAHCSSKLRIGDRVKVTYLPFHRFLAADQVDTNDAAQNGHRRGGDNRHKDNLGILSGDRHL